MEQQFMKTAFFDFDGVVVDTEPIYDIYWNEAGKRYQTGIPNFASHIKGTTLPYILEKYFSDRSEEFKEMVIRESMEFEQQMPFPPPICMYHLPTVWYLKTLLPEYRPGPMRVCGLSDLARPIPKSL